MLGHSEPQRVPAAATQMHAFGLVAERPARGTRSAEGLRVGVHPKVVQERLGHANVGITLDTYSHVMPGMQDEATEKIDAGLRKAPAK